MDSLRILRDLLSPRPAIALCWTGNDGWLVSHRGRLIGFDLDFYTPIRLSPPPLSTAQIGPYLDVVFVTHAHGDHLNPRTLRKLSRESDCRFVIPASCAKKAAGLPLPRSRTVVARPGVPLRLGALRVRPLRAIHGDRGTAVYRNANLDDCGYLLTVDRLTIAQPGDSILTEEHLHLPSVDVLFVSPTEHTMSVEPARLLIETIRPRLVFAQHFGTYRQTPANRFWTRGYVAELQASLRAPLRSRFHVPRQGEVYPVARRRAPV